MKMVRLRRPSCGQAWCEFAVEPAPYSEDLRFAEPTRFNWLGSRPTGPAKLLRIVALALLDANSRREWRAIGKVKSELL
jgi:hypothetical protein